MKTLKFTTFFCVVTLFVSPAFAGLQIPYTLNANTLHLWHIDDPLLIGGVTNIFATDAVATASITLTNLGNPTPGIPPYNNTSLGNASFAGLGTSLKSTDKFAFLYGGLFPDVSSFCNTNTGAFTFEALVNFPNNPLALPNNMEVVAGDQGGGLGNRGWQWRITTGGQMEFNLLGGNGSDNDWKANLPTSGSDAAVAGQWYHMAVSCTGNAPTNSDTPNQLKFYWTLLDANRTSADLLATFTMTRALNGATTITDPAGVVQPALGIGGSGRRIITGGNGVANGEGVVGQVDEVRISSVALASNQMAFVTGGALNPPTFNVQPPTTAAIGYGRTLTMPTLAVGTLPLSFQWQFTNTSSGGFTNLPSQTNNTLAISGITFPATGAYRLIVTNAYGSKTSVVAQVTVGAAFSELFNTGVDTNGVVDTNNLPTNPDLHYTLIQSSDFTHLGPSAIVWNMFTFPIASFNGNFSNPDGKSQWIGAQADSYSSPAGQYVYRIKFVLDSVDLTKPASLSGIWYVNESGNDILINGQSTGNSLPGAVSSNGKFSVPFSITSGFVAGVNTLDFVTTRPVVPNNGAYLESAVRVDMSDPVVQMTGVGAALPPGKPTVSTHPADQTVHDGSLGGQSVATFSVVALGRPPLSYQWYADGAQVSGASSRTLQFISPIQGAQGTNFSVVISNDSGSVTSHVAVLKILSTNQLPVAPSYSLTIYSNTMLNVDLDALYLASSDADGDPLTLSFDAATTNGTGLLQSGATLSFTPAPDYLGADQFNYMVTDGIDVTTSPININVVPLLVPGTLSAAHSGNNIVLSGGTGTPGGPFHVLSTTDLTTPLANWTSAATGAFDGSGNFNVALPISSTVPQTFYIISVP